MAFDVSALAAYVDETSDELLIKAVEGAKSKSLTTMHTGIKGTQDIHLLDADLTYQADGCELTASGDAILGKIPLSVAEIAVQLSLCNKDLIGKYTQRWLREGSNGDLDEVTFLYNAIIGDLVAKLQKQEEINVWQGDTAGSGNLAFYDGWLKKIDAAITSGTITSGDFVVGREYTIVTTGTTDFTAIGAADSDPGTTFTATGVGTGTGTALDVAISPINGNPTRITTATGISSTNAISIMQGIYNLVPTALLGKDGLSIMVGMDTFRAFQQALVNANLFSYNGQATDEIMLMGTNVPVIGVNGLNSTNRIIATTPDHLHWGTDLESDEDELIVENGNTPGDKKFYITSRFKSGTAISYPEQIVEFTLV
jgi:hypothetical protein